MFSISITSIQGFILIPLSWDLILLVPSLEHNINKRLMCFEEWFGWEDYSIQWCSNMDRSVSRGYALCCIRVGVMEQVLLVSGSLPCFTFLSRLVNVIGKHWHKHTNIKYQLDSLHTHACQFCLCGGRLCAEHGMSGIIRAVECQLSQVHQSPWVNTGRGLSGITPAWGVER